MRAVRCTLAIILAIPLVAHALHAQHRRADVRRIQWDPVAVHVAAEAPLGVELYVSVSADHWALTWIHPDSLAAWLPQIRALTERSAAADSTPWVGGSDASHFRVIKGQLQGRELYAIQLIAEPSRLNLQAWLTGALLSELSKSLQKGIDTEHDLELKSAPPNAYAVYEEWQVDSMPRGAETENFYAALPQYMVRGSAVVGFVVDSAGHIVPSSVTVYDCDDPNLAKQWGREVTAWHFVAGMRGGRPVATRVRMAFDLDTGHSLTVDNQRSIPGKP